MHNTKLIMIALLVLVSFGVSYAAPEIPMEPRAIKSYILADAVNRAVVHDTHGGVVHDEASGTCVRTRWMEDSDPCMAQVVKPEIKVEEKAQISLSREDRTVYFGFNQASLSPEMRQRLDTLAITLRSDSQVKGARIVGYADRIGNPTYNEKLSEKRAENVRQYLVERGLINTRVADTRWVGSRIPATDCPDGMKHPDLVDCLGRDRRVEVEIDHTVDLRAAR